MLRRRQQRGRPQRRQLPDDPRRQQRHLGRAGCRPGAVGVQRAGQPQGDSNPENYGCGRLSDGRLVTGDVGNQAGGPATGQLIIWFPPYDSFDSIAYCKLDVEIGTALQIAVDDDDNIYIASSLGRTDQRPAGVYRYSPP